MIAEAGREMLSQAAERAIQEPYEKFVQAGIEHWHRKQAEKERKKKEAEKSAEPGDRP